MEFMNIPIHVWFSACIVIAAYIKAMLVNPRFTLQATLAVLLWFSVLDLMVYTLHPYHSHWQISQEKKDELHQR